jgi:hypothetical protein
MVIVRVEVVVRGADTRGVMEMTNRTFERGSRVNIWEGVVDEVVGCTISGVVGVTKEEGEAVAVEVGVVAGEVEKRISIKLYRSTEYM